MKVDFRIIGTVKADNTCDFDVKCYDTDGFVIHNTNVHRKVSVGERFRFEDNIWIPSKTVRLKFERRTL